MVGLPIKTTHEKSEDGLSWVMKKEYSVPYRASLKAQLESWVAGKPTHCHFSDECCPDFSCCHPEGLWPEHKRRIFASAGKSVQMEMLMGALVTLTSETKINTKVYVANQLPNNKTIH